MKFNITLQDLRDLKPCYDPAIKLGDNFKGTLFDILNHTDIPADDKIWTVTRLLDEKTARLFSCFCAKDALKLIRDPDPRLLQTIEVSVRFANGLASQEELSAAEYAAWSAVESAAWSAAGFADEFVARSVARSANKSPFKSVPKSTSRYVNVSAQLEQLIKMIEELNK